MCGIFGTTNPKRDLTNLIEANQERGSAALSLFSPHIRLVLDEGAKGGYDHRPFEYEPFVLGHVHAPTGTPNADRHPFQWRDWFVAHNGVIHKAFEHFDYEQDHPHLTDSIVIPWIIQDPAGKPTWDGLSLLEGTFACWAYNYTEKQTYLFRWVNPLFINGPEQWFSSEKPLHSVASNMIEGTVIKWPQLERVAEFKPKEHPYNSLWRHNR